MADALNAQGIKLIIYLHAQIIADPNFKSHYSDMPEEQFSSSAIKMVTAISNRYGNRIAGYGLTVFLTLKLNMQTFPTSVFTRQLRREMQAG